MRGDDFLQATLGSMDLVHNLARRLMRNRLDAEDLVQDTYLQAYRAWGRRPRPQKINAWMATICLNLARSEFRRRGRRPEEVIDPEAGAGLAGSHETDTEAIARVQSSIVRRALWELPENQRIAVTLVDVCGFSAVQAARIMGTPRGTVLSRVHRGRKALATHVRSEVDVRDA